MQLVKLLCQVPWLITLCGVAPLTVVMVTGVKADRVAGQPVVMPDAPDPKEESDLRDVAAGAESARKLLGLIDWSQVPVPRSETQLPGKPAEDNWVGGTLAAHARLRLAERFSGKYVDLWGKRLPWMNERSLWQEQVGEHTRLGQGVKKLEAITRVAKSRIEALQGLEKGETDIGKLKAAYVDKDYLGAREIGDTLKNDLEKLGKNHVGDRDVPKWVTPWLKQVASIIDSSTFLAGFLQWKSAFDVRWPRLENELSRLRGKWEVSAKPPSFVLDREGTGRLQAEKLDSLLLLTGEAMAATQEEMKAVDGKVQAVLARVRTLRDSVPEDDVEALRDDAVASYRQMTKTLTDVQQQVDDASRLGELAVGLIESHELARVAWTRYQAAPGQQILKRFQQVAALLTGFPETRFPTGMIRQRLQCDMMDWLCGLFQQKLVFADATIQEARMAKSGWLIGRFEDPKKQADYILYKFRELDSKGDLDVRPTAIPSFLFHGKSGEFPRQPLTNDLIREFNALAKRSTVAFDDPERWTQFAREAQRLQDELDKYVTLRGGRKELRINKTLSFESEITALERLVEAAVHMKTLFPR